MRPEWPKPLRGSDATNQSKENTMAYWLTGTSTKNPVQKKFKTKREATEYARAAFSGIFFVWYVSNGDAIVTTKVY
jgi:hypothetical protein